MAHFPKKLRRKYARLQRQAEGVMRKKPNAIVYTVFDRTTTPFSVRLEVIDDEEVEEPPKSS